MIGDAGRIRQILLNVVGNAIKFTQQGHVLICVDCLDNTGQSARMRLSVTDTGIGIPPDQLAHIFKPFMQSDSSDTGQTVEWASG